MTTSTLLRAATKADRIATAEFATLAGYTTRSNLHGQVRCPMCADTVTATRQMIEYRLEEWGTALVGALVNHFDTCRVVTR